MIIETEVLEDGRTAYKFVDRKVNYFGATAFRKNECMATCPYPESGLLRKSWRYGWNYPERAFNA